MSSCAPKKLLTDNGPQFRGRVWKEGLERFNIHQVYTAIRNPQANPCERYIKTVGVCLRIICGNDHQTWGKHLMSVKQFLNCHYNIATNQMPVEIQTKKTFILDIEKDVRFLEQSPRQDWDRIFKEVYGRLQAQADVRNKYHKTRYTSFQVGQRVLVRSADISSKNKKKTDKLSPIYAGPATICKRLGINTYLVKMSSKANKCKVHNLRNLYPYVERNITGLLSSVAGEQDKVPGYVEIGNQADGLREEDQIKLVELLRRYHDIFSKHPGVFKDFELDLQTYEHVHFKVKERPIPLRWSRAVQEGINQMIERKLWKGRAAPIITPWCSSRRKLGRSGCVSTFAG